MYLYYNITNRVASILTYLGNAARGVKINLNAFEITETTDRKAS